jgi:diamine N-acetyltransferase
MTTPTTIRRAVPADAEALSALMRATFTAANGRGTTPENLALFLDAVYSPEKQAAEIANPDIATFIVEDGPDGDWAGFAQLRFATTPPLAVPMSHPVELGRIYLRSAFHGRGHAGALMARLVDEARARGGNGLWLSVWADAPQAIAYYTKHGFRVGGMTVFHVGNDPKDDLLMIRELTRS